VLALVGCRPVPGGAADADQARRQFSEAAFCPAYRVAIQSAATMAQPPAPIANDPERLAMWRRAWVSCNELPAGAAALSIRP